ncbi:MAG: aminopeptidase P family protein, partial [Sphingomonas sp.]
MAISPELPTRRTLLGAAAALPLLSIGAVLRAAEPDLSALSDLTGGAKPIDADERAARLSRAQALMKAAGIGAVLIEPGSSMLYFTGVRWSRSERLTAAILPVEGQPCIVTPFFEEPSVRETLAVPAEVRVWQEDQNPLAVVAGFLRDRRLIARPIAIEETMRFFAVDALRRLVAEARIVSANPVVRGCRMIKTPAEIALMQTATDVTLAAYRWTHARVE